MMAARQRSREEWHGSQGVSSIVSKHWKLEKAEFQNEQDPTDTLISDIQPSGQGDNEFYYFKPHSLENCVRTAGLNQYGSQERNSILQQVRSEWAVRLWRMGKACSMWGFLETHLELT